MLSNLSRQHLERFARAIARATSARVDSGPAGLTPVPLTGLPTLTDIEVVSDRERADPAFDEPARPHGGAATPWAGFLARVPWSRRGAVAADGEPVPAPAEPAPRLATDLLRSAPWSRRAVHISIAAAGRSAQVLPFQPAGDRRPDRRAAGMDEPAAGVAVAGFFSRLPWRGRAAPTGASP